MYLQTDTHRIVDAADGRLCGSACRDNKKTYMVRLNQDGFPYLAGITAVVSMYPSLSHSFQ